MPCLVAILYSMRHRERLLSMAACRLTNASAFRTRPCPGCKDQGAQGIGRIMCWHFRGVCRAPCIARTHRGFAVDLRAQLQ